MLELMKAKAAGLNAAVIVVAQREDAKSFTPNRETDPVFSEAIAMAAKAGVKVYAYRCSVTTGQISLLGRIPVYLDPADLP